MKKNSKNTLSNQHINTLINLLQKGYSLEKSLEIMHYMDKNNLFLYLSHCLKEGMSVEEVFKSIHKNKSFNEILQSLLPIKGLSNALIDSMSYINQKTQWTNFLKKQLLYPMILIFVMLGFSIFVKAFLLPEMTLLYESFNLNNHQSFNFTLIHLIPNILLIISFILFCAISIIAYNFKTIKKNRINAYLKIPVLKPIIQTYFSLKFAFFFSRFSDYFQSFFDTIDYFYKSCSKSSLKIILDDLYFQIKNGDDLQFIINNCIYFTSSFKQFFYMISISKQSYSSLDDYCEITFKQIEHSLKRLTNTILAIMYLLTGLYIMCLYTLMIVPVLEITAYF